MKIKGIMCLACLMLLGGYYSADAAPMMGQAGTNMNMRGTCLTENAPCNQREEWQYPQQVPGEARCGLLTGDLAATTPLTIAEQQSLSFMREEEKLARDLYQAFYQQWRTPVFANLAMSEQQHMDAILCLMQGYGLADSATSTLGTFNNTELQALYNSLIARGSASQAEALYSGAYVEEADIKDLQAALAATANKAVTTVYGNLLDASEQHLRRFVGNIEDLGFVYTAQLLDAAQVIEILNGDNEHVGVALSRKGQMQPTLARFNGLLSTDTGKYGNHLEVTQQERLNIGMCVTPDQQHLGQFADIVNVASYTPAGSQETWMFMRSGQNAWQPWDGNPATLVPAEARRQLMGQNRFTIHDGQLQAPGSFRIQAGYRLQDGTAVLCGAPVEFIVE